MKRPLLIVALGYIIGIVWGLYCNCSIALLYAIIFFLSNIIKTSFKSPKKFKMFSIKRYFRYIKIFLNFNVILTILVSSLISNSIVIYQNKKYNNLYSNVKDVNVKGVIVSNIEEREYKKTCKIKVESINDDERFKNTNLILNIKKSYNVKIEYGDKVIVKGEYKVPSSQRNYKGFDYKQYLKTKKVYGIVDSTYVKTIDKSCVNSAFMYSNKYFVNIKYNLKRVFPDKYSNLLNAIILGDTIELDDNIESDFRDSSIAHILAISGIHITYIIFFVTKLLEIFLGKRKSKITTIIVLVIYMFITGFTPSAVRATVMGVLFLFSKIIYKKNDTWSSLSLSILCVLIYNPFLILHVGVLLSYTGVIGILLFNNSISSVLNKIKIKNKKYKYRIKKYEKQIKFVKDTLAISISVQVMILPIIINAFNTINLTFMVTNLILSIIIVPIVILGFVTMLTALLYSGFLKIMLYPNITLLQLLIIVSKLGSKLPFHKIYFITLNIWEISIYYILIFIINFIYRIYIEKEPSSFQYRIRNIIGLIKYNIRLNKKKIIIRILIICIIFSIIIIIPQKLQIHFIDVGQGDSTLIITPMKKSILIDGGGSLSDSFDVGQNTLLPYLLDRRITKIDYIIITHMDQDHVRADF